VKAALELGRWVFLTPMHDPARAPVVRRAFEDYATGRFTRVQLFKRARNWASQIGEASRSRRRRLVCCCGTSCTPASQTCPSTAFATSGDFERIGSINGLVYVKPVMRLLPTLRSWIRFYQNRSNRKTSQSADSSGRRLGLARSKHSASGSGAAAAPGAVIPFKT
jgi:hypothetical protein